MFKNWRRKAGFYSQKELAEKLGVCQTTVFYWESGQIVPDALELESLSNLLNVPMVDIIAFFKAKREEQEKSGKD